MSFSSRLLLRINSVPVFRVFSTSSVQNEFSKDLPVSMSAWQINDYNGYQSLELVDGLDIPPLSHPNDVLVKVKAASLNNLDLMMTEGYGKQVFEQYGKLKPDTLFNFNPKTPHLPLILGRDFAGVVQAVGEGVKKFKPGDEVMGVIPPPLPGSHAQYVITSCSNMKRKPHNLSMEEAASIPYAGLTAWSALSISGELCLGSKGKKILILGASGGVGTIAVQLGKVWGSEVVSTCSANAIPSLVELGSDTVIDYTSPEAEVELQQQAGFDIILDCTGRRENFPYGLLKSWSNAKYITLSPPILSNFDNLGVVGGLAKTGLDLLSANSSAILEGKTLRWAFFVPSSSALEQLRNLAAEKKLKTIIESVFPYERLPEAYAKLKDGHSLGKIIVKM